MTITSLPVRNEVTAAGGQTIFDYTFKIYTNNDLNVYITPSGQEANDSTDLTTAYTVDVGTIGNEDGGFITLSSGVSAGDLVTIVSNIVEDRTTDYQNSGDFLPDTVNEDFDRTISIAKQTDDRSGRTLAFQESLQNASALTLSNPSALQFLRWKADETGLENVDLAASGSATLASLVTYDDGGIDVNAALNTVFNGVNLLINPRFNINQRVFAGGALSAGDYGFDMMKARTGGANLSKSGNVITIATGGIEQVIQNRDLESTTITLDARDSTGSITGFIDGAVTSVTGPLPLTVTLQAGDTGDITVGVSGTAVTFEELKVGNGSSVVNYNYVGKAQDLRDCQGYMFKTYDQGTAPGTASSNSGSLLVAASTTTIAGILRISVQYPAMVGTPTTITSFNPDTGASGFLFNVTGGSNITATVGQIGDSGATVTNSAACSANNVYSTHLVAVIEP